MASVLADCHLPYAGIQFRENCPVPISSPPRWSCCSLDIEGTPCRGAYALTASSLHLLLGRNAQLPSPLHSCLCPDNISSDRPPDHSLLGDGTCPKHFVLTLFYFSSQDIPSLPQTLQIHVFAFCTVVVTTTRSTGIVYVK